MCVCVVIAVCVHACESVCYLFCDGSWEGEWGEYVYLYVAAYALMNTEWMSFQNCPYKGGSPPIEEKNHTNTSLGTYMFWSAWTNSSWLRKCVLKLCFSQLSKWSIVATFNAVLIRLVAQVKISLLLKIQYIFSQHFAYFLCILHIFSAFYIFSQHFAYFFSILHILSIFHAFSAFFMLFLHFEFFILSVTFSIFSKLFQSLGHFLIFLAVFSSFYHTFS